MNVLLFSHGVVLPSQGFQVGDVVLRCLLAAAIWTVFPLGLLMNGLRRFLMGWSGRFLLLDIGTGLASTEPLVKAARLR